MRRARSNRRRISSRVRSVMARKSRLLMDSPGGGQNDRGRLLILPAGECPDKRPALEDVAAQVLVLDDLREALPYPGRVELNALFGEVGQLEQHVFEQVGHDGVEPAGADVFHALVGLGRDAGDLLDAVGRELERGALGGAQRGVLLGERVLGLRHDADEVLLGERLQLHADREASLQLGDQVGGLGDVERAGGDEQHVVGADLAVTCLAGRALDDGKQVALHAFARHVGPDGAALARDLVELVDEDHAVVFDPIERFVHHVVHVDELLELLVDQDAAGFVQVHGAALLFLRHHLLQPLGEVEVRALHALRRLHHFQHRESLLLHLDLHLALLELSLLELQQQGFPMLEMMQPPQGMEGPDFNFTEWLQDVMPKKKKRRTVHLHEARRILVDEELKKLVDMDDVVNEALDRVENHGVIFIDELDKIAGERGTVGPDVSREGVQRDLLPIVEGSTVQTRYGYVRTDHVLFIAAGAFHVSKPSDLIPELQGRFPIRVELQPLTEEDFVRIMTEPENALTKQYAALCAAEGATLEFTPDGIKEIARIAAKANERMENIGARRLHTVMTNLLEDVLFDLPDLAEKRIKFDATRVRERLAK